ncbi:glycoside hydrolase family protein [Agromyces aerolatus]|uniref:glycosyl hydrolase family 32 n=1 Tax=Agromyces sp. LY-1074 TaxID=3074080 RepID=UPI00285A19E3|nr:MULTISPECIES: glycosyl hydrolase family 32 [unclassified Agromyces]MDR5699730.1 glycosyl hydrolase family 32 [Agromyces sp. LY-1074]MDR5706026.1 glycosyl hydrolase family 32 [Agromyces sp. LY-1358]
MLRLEDHWVWDSWYAESEGTHHAFFLRASRALGDPERRHGRASVGHAVSKDLRTWTLEADALVPADAPAWDDQAIWTGSTVQGDDGRWYLFYTGISQERGTAWQQIGAAVSDDLVSWQRVGDAPVLSPDPRWYEVDDPVWRETAWRDPWVFPDADGDGWHMLFTARAKTGDPRERGVVGHATSPDLRRWSAGPPLSGPAGFAQLEVIQTTVVDGRHVLLFSCAPAELGAARDAAYERGDVYLADAAGPLGPYDIEHAQPVGPAGLYAARIVLDRGTPRLIGFTDQRDGRFVGELTDPLPLAPTA